MIGLELLKRLALPIAGLLLAFAVAFAIGATGWRMGTDQANSAWQSKWDSEQSRLSDAKAAAEAEQRNIEQARQQAANEAAQNGQNKIDTANADADAARADADSVRRDADAIVNRLVASQARLSACTTDAGKAAVSAARVLADVFKRADERAGELASVADQARARGLTCEAAYDGLNSK